MINLRYHIVSITAVFLALGIGLAFGAAFIDRATVEALNSNLAEIEGQNRDLEDENDRLSELVDQGREVEEGLLDQGLGQLVAGHLEGVPVLVLAGEGSEDELVGEVTASVTAAGARVGGVLRVTDRMALEEESELEDLREVLGRTGASADQARTAVVRQLRTVLAGAMAPAPDLDEAPDEEPVPVPVPGIIQALIDSGFLELEVVDLQASLIPERGLRVVVVADHDDPDAAEGLLLPLAEALATPLPIENGDTTKPLLVVEPRVPEPDDDQEPLDPYVSVIRADDVIGPRTTTVDGVDSFAGLTALVLGLEAAGDGRFGHYGTLDDAQRLLPAPVL